MFSPDWGLQLRETRDNLRKDLGITPLAAEVGIQLSHYVDAPFSFVQSSITETCYKLSLIMEVAYISGD